jgi:GTP cyclohydrolase III
MITNNMNPTTVIASVQPKMLSQVTEQLKHTQGITYVSPVTGRFDLAVELKTTTDQKQIYELVNKIRTLTGVTSTTTYMPFEGFVNGRNVQTTDALALVLLQVNENTNVQKVLQSLEQQSQIRNASVVTGDVDILATVYGKNTEEVLSTVSKMAEMQGVRSSETLLAYKPIWA